MVSTKFYCKTMELEQKADKPYIRRVWQQYHLVDDWYEMTKTGADGKPYKPKIWRVEFSIKSSTRGWFIIEDVQGVKKQIRSIRNTMDCYNTKQKQLDMFLSLADHYFHFKIYEAGKRKDRCKDKLLFRFNERAVFYKLETLPSAVNNYVRDLEIVSVHRDDVPRDLYDADGVAHRVTKYYYTRDVNGVLYDKAGKCYNAVNGWVSAPDNGGDGDAGENGENNAGTSDATNEDTASGVATDNNTRQRDANGRSKGKKNG